MNPRKRTQAINDPEPYSETEDRYNREVKRVGEYIHEHVLRGRNLQGLIFDCACQFPGLRLSVFHDALMLVHTRGGGDALGRPQ